MNPPADTAAEEFLQLYGQEAWADWRRLLAHFDMGDGFSFLVLVLPGAVGANICQRHLAGHLAASGKRLAELPCLWRDETRQLADRLMSLEPSGDLGGIWLGSVIPESDPEIEAWKEAWRLGLGALNQHRNPLLRRFRCPLVLVGAPWLYPLLRESAPDLWSVRATVVQVRPDAGSIRDRTSSVETRPVQVMSGEAASDPDYALEQAERLRGKAGLETRRAELLLRAGNGFHEHVRFEPAEWCFREAAGIYASQPTPSPEVLRDWAGALNNLANTLSDLGRREEALERAEEAVRIFEKLAKGRPDAFLPDLATSLNNLANSLSGLGRREEALEKAEEAVRIREQLAKARPAAFLPDLAGSLHNLAHVLGSLGRRKEALEKAEEAVRIYELLAKTRPDAFLPDLAMSLNNLAIRLSDLGRREEALENAEEAVRIYEQLAKARPDAYLPDLAASLNNVADSLSDSGRLEEALEKAEEAVRIHEQLPNLAVSLNNLANRLSDLGRIEEALEKAQQAVRIWEEVAKVRPDVVLTNLASSYGTCGAAFRRLEEYTEAAASFAQGIEALTPLFQYMPAANTDLMAGLVRDYLAAIELAGQEPNKALLAPVTEILEKLKENRTKE